MDNLFYNIHKINDIDIKVFNKNIKIIIINNYLKIFYDEVLRF